MFLLQNGRELHLRVGVQACFPLHREKTNHVGSLKRELTDKIDEIFIGRTEAQLSAMNRNKTIISSKPVELQTA